MCGQVRTTVLMDVTCKGPTRSFKRVTVQVSVPFAALTVDSGALSGVSQDEDGCAQSGLPTVPECYLIYPEAFALSCLCCGSSSSLTSPVLEPQPSSSTWPWAPIHPLASALTAKHLDRGVFPHIACCLVPSFWCAPPHTSLF